MLYWIVVATLAIVNGCFAWYWTRAADGYTKSSTLQTPSTLRLVRQHWRSQPAPSNALSSLWHEYGALLSARCCCAFWTYIPDAETYLRAALGLLGSLLRHRQGVPVVVLVGFNRSDQAFTRIAWDWNPDHHTPERGVYLKLISRAAAPAEQELVVRKLLHTPKCAGIPRRLLRLDARAMLLEPITEVFLRPDWLQVLSWEQRLNCTHQSVQAPLRYRVRLAEQRLARRAALDQSQLLSWYRADWRMVHFEPGLEPGNLWRALLNPQVETGTGVLYPPASADVQLLEDFDLPLVYDWLRNAERWMRRVHKRPLWSPSPEMHFRNRFCHHALGHYRQRNRDARSRTIETFTVLVNAFSRQRIQAGLLEAILERYCRISSVASIVVLVYELDTLQIAEDLGKRLGGCVPIRVLRLDGPGADSLNHRFLPLPSWIETAAVLHTDDDVVPVHDALIEFGFRQWRKRHAQQRGQPNLVGFVPRYADPQAHLYALRKPPVSRSKAQHIWDRRDAVQSYNIVLTKLAFVPHIYHFLYTCILPYIPLVEPDAMDLLNMVDRVRNCEDIVMQGLASVVAGKQSPLVVRGLSSADLADYGSTDDQHAISMGEHASLRVTSAGNPMTMTRLSGFDAHLWQRGQCVVAVQQTLGRGEYASSIFSEQTSVAAPFEAAPVPVQRDLTPVCSVVNTMNAVWVI